MEHSQDSDFIKNNIQRLVYEHDSKTEASVSKE